MTMNSLLRRLTVAAFALLTTAATANAQDCPHGMTAIDIAAKSGLNLTGKVALVTGGRSGLVSHASKKLIGM